MPSWRLFLLGALTATAVTTTTAGPPSPEQPPAIQAAGVGLPFTGVAYGNNSRIRGSRFIAVRDEPTWERLWREHTGADTDRPAIDFPAQTVVAVFAGIGVGYEIHVARVEARPNDVLVHIEKLCVVPPSTPDRRPVTTPFNLVVLPRRLPKVAFAETVIHPEVAARAGAVASPKGAW